MKLDYSVKFTDKRNSAIIRGITSNGDNVFVRRTMPDGKPVTWEKYNSGMCMYARWEPFFSINIRRLDD